MEGICGLISFDSVQTDRHEKIKAMAHELSDGESLEYQYYYGPTWALGCSSWDKNLWQPMTYSYQDDQLVLVAVGDIYNFTQLAAELDCSTEGKGRVLAELYRRRKNDWASSIRGNFAIIVFDKIENRVVCATDRVGIRPLIWYKSNNTIYVASRINAIKKVCPNLEINPEAIYAVLHHEMIPAPLTVYNKMYKLEPGCKISFKIDGHDVKRYWDITVQPKRHASTDEIGNEVFSTLKDAVRIMSNGIANPEELACFLSGGTDSSSICGLLSQIQDHNVQAYSVGFPENGYDEMYYARLAAKAYDLEHHEYYAKPENVLDALPLMAKAYDEPYGNSSITPAYFCAQEARQNGVTYILAGDGGDEVFGGNDRYSTQQVFRNYFKVPVPFRKGLLEPLLVDRMERLPIGLFQKAGSYIRRANMPEVQRIHSYRYIDDDDMFDSSFLQNATVSAIEKISEDHYQRLEDANALDRHLYLDMKMTISDNDLVKVSRMSELAGVRVRYPMLDHPLIELGFRIPPNLKLRNTTGLRYIFKHAFRDLLPQEILQKQKHGFGLPISIWLRENRKIKEFARDLLFDRAHLQRGYFRDGFVEKIWKLQLEDKTSYYGTVLWQLIILECWHKIHWEGSSL